MGGHRVWIAFNDGVAGELDLMPHLKFTGVFEALRKPSYFAQVRVDDQAGTIAWPNEANVDPIVLYSWVTKRAVESILADPDLCKTRS